MASRFRNYWIPWARYQARLAARPAGTWSALVAGGVGMRYLALAAEHMTFAIPPEAVGQLRGSALIIAVGCGVVIGGLEWNRRRQARYRPPRHWSGGFRDGG